MDRGRRQLCAGHQWRDVGSDPGDDEDSRGTAGPGRLRSDPSVRDPRRRPDPGYRKWRAWRVRRDDGRWREAGVEPRVQRPRSIVAALRSLAFGMIVHLVDGTFELFRHFYGARRFTKGVDAPFGAVFGVLNTAPKGA